MAAKAKAVGQGHVNIRRLLLLANQDVCVGLLLGVVQVQVGVQEACKEKWHEGREQLRVLEGHITVARLLIPVCLVSNWGSDPLLSSAQRLDAQSGPQVPENCHQGRLFCSPLHTAQ